LSTEADGDLNALPDGEGHKASSLDAARDMIVHIHQLFTLAPSLRRWSYYCFYCLQATLVLLMKLTDEPFAEEIETLKSLCGLSVQVFEQIELKAAKRCAEIVQRVMDQAHERAGAWATSGNLTWSPEERRHAQSQQRSSQGVPISLPGPSFSSPNTNEHRLQRLQDGHLFDAYDGAGPLPITNTTNAPDHDANNDENLWFPFYLVDDDWSLQALQGFASSTSL
jgi:hypothetical protein